MSARWQSGSGGDRAYWAARFAAEIDAWIEVVDRHLRWVETLSSPADSFLLLFGSDVVSTSPAGAALHPFAGRAGTRHPGADGDHQSPLSPEMPPEASAWIGAAEGRRRSEAEKNAAIAALELRKLQQSLRRLADGINHPVPLRPAQAPARRRLCGGRSRRSSPATTICSPANAVWRAWSRSPKATSRWNTGSRSGVPCGPNRRAAAAFLERHHVRVPDAAAVHPQLRQFSARSCLPRRGRRARSLSARESGVPWGISESAYSALDAQQTYQYRAFGVPELALNPEADDRPGDVALFRDAGACGGSARRRRRI